MTVLYPEAQARTNPPFMHWQAHPEAARYEIRLSGPEAMQFDWESRINFYTPETALPQGDYRIEVIAFDASDSILDVTGSGSFTIALPPASSIPSMNRFPALVHSPFYPTDSMLDAIREATGERGALRDRLLEAAKEPLPAVLESMEDLPFYKNGVWNRDQWTVKNDKGFAIREYPMIQAMAWRLTGERKHLDNARGILLQAAKWDANGGLSVWESDHAAQAILHSMAVCYNLLHDDLSAEERAILTKAIRARAADMYDFQNPFVLKELSGGLMNNPDNNHAWFCTSGLGIAGLSLLAEAPEAEAWLALAAQLYYGVYLPRGGKDGSWHEGIDYWSYTLYFVLQFMDALKTGAGVDLYRDPWLQSTAIFKIYTHPPEGGYVPFGNSKNRPPNSFVKLIAMCFASEYSDPVAWAYVDAIFEPIGRGFLYDALLWSDRGGVKASRDMNVPFAVNFKDTGWVVSNNNVFDATHRMLFAFRCGPVIGNGAHTHADQNSFIVDAGGDSLLCDSGYYDWYGSPHHLGYTVTTQAHNTILIDATGQRQPSAETSARLTEFSLNGTTLRVRGDASNPAIYGGKAERFVRTIDYRNEKDFTVSDEIRLTAPARATWQLHSAFPIQFDEEDNRLVIQGKRYRLEGRFESLEPFQATVHKGFPIPPSGDRPDQYRLELATKAKIKAWNPKLAFSVQPMRTE